MAPHLIESPTTRSGGDEERGSKRGGVSERHGRGDPTQKYSVAPGPWVARMTSVNVLERMNALIDGMIRSFNKRRKGRNEVQIRNPG